MPNQQDFRMLGPPQQAGGGGMQGGISPMLLQILQQFMQRGGGQMPQGGGMQGPPGGGMQQRMAMDPMRSEQPRGAGWYPDVTRPGYFTPNQSGQPVGQPSFSPGPPGGGMTQQPGWMGGPNQPGWGSQGPQNPNISGIGFGDLINGGGPGNVGAIQPGSWMNSLFGMLSGAGGGGFGQQPGRAFTGGTPNFNEQSGMQRSGY